MTELDKATLAKLEAPFDPEDVKWRPGSTYTKDNTTSAIGLAYADSRHYFSRLNEVVGDWSDSYDINVTPDRVFITCSLTVRGFTRTDVGEEPLMTEKWENQKKVVVENDNALTTAAAQAFKRACVKFGLGAFFYKLPTLWGEIDQRKRFTENAERKFASNLRDWLAANYGIESEPAPEPIPEPAEPDNNKKSFASPQAAIEWAMLQGAFDNKPHAKNTYNKLRDDRQPTTAEEMAELWKAEVHNRMEQVESDVE